MKTTIEVKSIEQKTGRTGKPYWTVATDQGAMNCFDTAVIEELKGCLLDGHFAEVEVAESGGFKNIREFYNGKADKPKDAQFADNIKKKCLAMFISYAKDLCVAGKIETSQIRAYTEEFLRIYEEL